MQTSVVDNRDESDHIIKLLLPMNPDILHVNMKENTRHVYEKIEHSSDNVKETTLDVELITS